MTIRNLWLILSAASSLCAATHHVTPETVSSLKSICEHARPGDDIVFHKGIYNAPFPHINCNGAPGKPITLTADVGGYVLIRRSWRVHGNYLVIQNLNFKGDNESITYESVIQQWWHPSEKIRTGGLLIEGHHIVFQNNTVGYFPASGIKFIGNSDYLTITHNIVYNNAWWSTGGTGGLIVKNIHQFDDSKAQKVIISNNLLFGNESRVFSHVFKKGFAKLVIDEGESLLLQQKDDPRKKGAQSGHYEGRYLVKGNLILYNGKGTSFNKSEHIDFVANDLYCNGTTNTSPTAAGIRGNRTHHDIFLDNAIEVCKPKDLAVSVIGSDNRFENNYAKGKQIQHIEGISFVSSLFHDPKHLNFQTPYFRDRANTLLASFRSMVEQNNIVIKPTGYVADIEKQREEIIDLIPKKHDTRIVRTPHEVHIYNIDNRGIKDLPEDFLLKLP